MKAATAAAGVFVARSSITENADYSARPLQVEAGDTEAVYSGSNDPIHNADWYSLL